MHYFDSEQATIFTANGSILSASSSENTDLFFAIRGGGGNFGVVTEFVFQLHPQRLTVYSGIVLFPASALEKLIKATNEWWVTASEKESMLQVTTVDPNGNVCFLQDFDYYLDSERSNSIFSQSLHYSLSSMGQNRRAGRNSNLSST